MVAGPWQVALPCWSRGGHGFLSMFKNLHRTGTERSRPHACRKTRAIKRIQAGVAVAAERHSFSSRNACSGVV